jgi:hypothetical protein
MAGMVSGLDKIIAAHKKNRTESPWHYWGNPWVMPAQDAPG